jgi:hypothetical protein
VISPTDPTTTSNDRRPNTLVVRRNVVVRGLQLVAWLLLHPSAWRTYVAAIEPSCSPDFSIAGLSRGQWRNPALRRLLLEVYVGWPPVVCVVAGVVLLAAGVPGVDVAAGLAIGLAVAITFSLWVGLCTSVVAGTVGGLVGGLATSIAGGFAFNLARNSGVIAPSVISAPTFMTAASISLGLLGGAAGSGASVLTAWGDSHPAARRLGSASLAAMSIVVGGFAFGLGRFAAEGTGSALAFGMAWASTGGVIGSAIFGAAAGSQSGRWRVGAATAMLAVVFFVTTAVIGGTAYEPVGGVLSSGLGYMVGAGNVAGAESSALFVLSFLLVRRFAGPRAAALAGGLGSGACFAVLLLVYAPFNQSLVAWPAIPLGLTSIGLGLTLVWWLPVVLHPFLTMWNLLLLLADQQRTGDRPLLLRWHSVFWCEFALLQFWGLDTHLVLAAKRNPANGRAVLEYVVATRQRWAAQAAQIELDARRLESCADVEALRRVHIDLAPGELTGPASALLRSFGRVSRDVDVALRQESTYNRRLHLSACEKDLDGLSRELVRSSERYAVRFRLAASRWRDLVANYVHELAAAVELSGEIDSPYVIGVPLRTEEEIFIGRVDVGTRIEQLILDRRRPPLLLYGQRRMGKTSLLNNLGRLLPSTIVPLFIDLQGPITKASDDAGFFYNLARGMARSSELQRRLVLPTLSRETLSKDPFTRFDEWLDAVEGSLDQATALLALDELEVLDTVLAEQRFREADVLGMLRHIIQHRPRFKVILAGSHTLDELERWARYLINVQVVPISYLSEAEARQLIERPVPDFPLIYDPDASQEVLEVTRGHPYLVQLLCAEIVALKNEQAPTERRRARLPDVVAAIPKALVSGHLFFADIAREPSQAQAMALLRLLADRGQGAVVTRQELASGAAAELDRNLEFLVRRGLVERIDGGFRIQVELIRRWIARVV